MNFNYLFIRKPAWISRTSLFILLILTGLNPLWAGQAKNVILMITDGAGFNTFDCASYYQYGETGRQPYDRFPIRMASTTYPALGSYDPVAFWSDFKYPPKGATDSAAAATALNTGHKTENGMLGMEPDETLLTSFAQIASQAGKSTGAVTTVPISHATPAGVWSHNKSRSNYLDIAREMILQSDLNVIMGAGNPYYDDNGVKLSKPEAKYIALDLFDDLRDKETGKDWRFIENKVEFELLAQTRNPGFARIVGITQVASTLQEKRKATERNKNVPDLATMSRAALNVLNQDPDGFYLMIEGGAVDWANHDNKLDRMIDEMVDFNQAISAVLDWLKENGQLENTLLIITSDHECGNVWGSEAGLKSRTPFDLPKNSGKGRLPAANHYSTNHTNALVPLFATGPRCEEFLWLVRGLDATAARTWGFSGSYVDNTDIITVMNKAIQPD